LCFALTCAISQGEPLPQLLPGLVAQTLCWNAEGLAPLLLKLCIASQHSPSQQRGKMFHTYGEHMSVKMAGMLKSISVFFNYLGIKVHNALLP
jgi:hypothetical protein